MAGGSADAAAMLVAVNEYLSIEHQISRLSDQDLLEIAKEFLVELKKFNTPDTLSNRLYSQLYELKVNEIALNPNNAVEIYGNLDNGDFTVGEHDYNYRIIKLDKNPYSSDSFYNIDFHEIGNKNPNPSLPTKNARENYIKILSTIYKIILNFTKEKNPEYIGISSLETLPSLTMILSLTDSFHISNIIKSSIKYLLITLVNEGNAKQTDDDTMTVDFPVTLWEKVIDFVERLS